MGVYLRKITAINEKNDRSLNLYLIYESLYKQIAKIGKKIMKSKYLTLNRGN